MGDTKHLYASKGRVHRFRNRLGLRRVKTARARGHAGLAAVAERTIIAPHGSGPGTERLLRLVIVSRSPVARTHGRSLACGLRCRPRFPAPVGAPRTRSPQACVHRPLPGAVLTVSGRDTCGALPSTLACWTHGVSPRKSPWAVEGRAHARGVGGDASHASGRAEGTRAGKRPLGHCSFVLCAFYLFKNKLKQT